MKNFSTVTNSQHSMLCAKLGLTWREPHIWKRCQDGPQGAQEKQLSQGPAEGQAAAWEVWEGSRGARMLRGRGGGLVGACPGDKGSFL